MIIKETTREDINRQTKTCIDHMFVRINKTITAVHSAIITTTISDHYSLFGSVEYDNKLIDSDNRSSQGAEYNVKQTTTLNTNKINRLIKTINWKEIVNQNTNTNDLFTTIHKTFEKYIKKLK